MAVPADAVAGVVQTATANAGAIERSNEQLAAADPDAPPADGFDVWRHTAAGIPGQTREDPADAWGALAESPSGEWAETDVDSVGASLERQAADAWRELELLRGDRKPEEGEADPDSLLSATGVTFGLLTTLEQMVSAPLSALPFPAFPALRVTDMDIGLPHAHMHPPNLVPPAPPTPFPSTGPIIPIPFLSGATRTLVNGMPAARCGDMGLGVWCGGYFPMYEVFLGSSSVWIEGARAGRLLVDVTRHCMFSSPRPSDPPLGPMVGMTITASPNVLVGGLPMPSLLSLSMGLLFKKLFQGFGKALKRVRAERAARGADDVVDDAASAMSRNARAAGAPRLPRPTRDSYWRRALHAAGGDVGEAVRRRARSRALVDGMIADGRLAIGGDEAFQRAVKEDLYLMGSTDTGRRTLERLNGPNHAGVDNVTYIHPLADAGEDATGPSAHRLQRSGKFDRDAGQPGQGADTSVFYDPHSSHAPNTPPDAVLNHEMGHAANNANGVARPDEPAMLQEQPHMTAEQRGELDPGGEEVADRWTDLEEQNVILETDNPYRRETGLPVRFGHGDVEGLNAAGAPRR
jgi:uncharacterized Zn-binding protein involved in type VI secretion